MAMLANSIYIGSVSTPLYFYSNRSVEMGSLNGLFSVDTIGNELSVDTFSFTVRYNPTAANLVYAPIGKDGYKDTNGKIYRLSANGRTSAKDYLTDLTFGVPVYWYVNNSFFSKGYIKSVERTAKYAWKITCISGIGLLDSKTHVGGIYSGETFKNIAKSIIGDAFSYSINSTLGNVQMYGHLPYDTARNNLHRLLFAVGASMVRNSSSTDYTLKFLESTTTSVPSSRIAINGSVETQLPTNRVEITEHNYDQIASAEEATLYDNVSNATPNSADNVTVVFNEPMYNLTATSGLTINESGANYAIVSGYGVLTGKKYNHTERIIVYDKSGGDTKRIKRVTENHLISGVNSWNVAYRVMDYYSSAKTVKAKIMLSGEKCGQNLSFTDSFGDATTAFLESMTVLVTSVRGATCKMISGFTPEHYGNNYTAYTLFNYDSETPSYTYTITQGGVHRFLLVGGGQGGTGGYKGADGMAGYAGNTEDNPDFDRGDLVSYYGTFYEYVGVNLLEFDYYKIFYRSDHENTAPKGGKGGAPGTPGKIYIVDLNLAVGDVVTITPGAGGSAGAQNGGIGGLGAASTIQVTGSVNLTVSSDSGTVLGGGYHDALTGITFARRGSIGLDGADGGLGGEVDADGGRGAENGGAGAGINFYNYDYEVFWYGGSGGAKHQNQASASYYCNLGGGGGSGAAWGANGNNGGTGSSTFSGGAVFTQAKGANGANATAPTSTAQYGKGGDGGNGGGGAGNAGEMNICGNGYDPQYSTINFAAKAVGGNGSAGATGGHGCVVMYYNETEE